MSLLAIVFALPPPSPKVDVFFCQLADYLASANVLTFEVIGERVRGNRAMPTPMSPTKEDSYEVPLPFFFPIGGTQNDP